METPSRRSEVSVFDAQEVQEFGHVFSRNKILRDGFDPPTEGQPLPSTVYETARILITPFIENGKLKLKYRAYIPDSFGRSQGIGYLLQVLENSLGPSPKGKTQLLPRDPKKVVPYIEAIVELGEASNGTHSGTAAIHSVTKGEKMVHPEAYQANLTAAVASPSLEDTGPPIDIPEPPTETEPTPEGPVQSAKDPRIKQLIQWDLKVENGSLVNASIGLKENSSFMESSKILKLIQKGPFTTDVPFPKKSSRR